MIGDLAIELAVIRGADRALRRAAERARVRAAQSRASDNLGQAAIEDRNAAAWSACADDVAALKGPREPPEPTASVVDMPRPTSGQGGASVKLEDA